MLKPRISSKELLELAFEKIDTPINSQDEYNLREEIKQKILKRKLEFDTNKLFKSTL
jgi:hypothetical protein